MSTQRLSLHFPYEDAVFSDTAVRHQLDNTPPANVLTNMYATAAKMELVRELLGNCPIIVTSWYRSPAVNEKVCGSSRPSAHMDGWAVDFKCPMYGTPRACAQRIAESELVFDQLIWEGTWVHISFAPTLRRQVLTATFSSGGNVTYTKGV